MLGLHEASVISRKPINLPLLLLLWSTALLLSLLSQVSLGAEFPTSNYKSGSVYVYNYSTNVYLKETFGLEESESQNIHHVLTSEVEIEAFNLASSNDQILRVGMKFTQVSISGKTIDEVEKESPLSFFIEKKGSLIERVHVDEDISTHSANVIKGLASLFNFRRVNWQGREIDTSGECQVRYIADNDHLLEKQKTNCLNTDLLHERESLDEVFSVEKMSETKMLFTFHETGYLLSARSNEMHKLSTIIDSTLGSFITADQILDLVSSRPIGEAVVSGHTVDEILASSKKVYKEVFLGSTLEEESRVEIDELEKVIKEEHKYLSAEETATLPATRAFGRLLRIVRRVENAPELTKLIDSNEYSEIQLQLLDLYIACQTNPCVRAVMKYVNFADLDKDDIHERILFVISYLPSPSENLVEQFLKIVNETKFEVEIVRYQAIHTLGTLVGNFASTGKGKYSELVKKVTDYMSESYLACTLEDCSLAHLGAIQNSKLSEFIEPLLTSFRVKGTSTLLQTAILKSLKTIRISEKGHPLVSRSIFQIFHYPTIPYDNSVKVLAFDILLKLETPEDALFGVIFQERNNTHFVQPTVQKLNSWCRAKLLKAICQRIRREPQLNNYYILTGTSLSQFAEGVIAESSEFMSDFQLHMLSSASGIVKRSQMDVSLIGTTGETSLLSVGLFASGLDTLVTTPPESTEEASSSTSTSEDVTAGVMISVLGKSLRSVRFFVGQGGLMAAVWNAPSSPVTFLDGFLSILDHHTALHLQNGLVLKVTHQGLASIELSGSIQISLWSRKASSHVGNTGALVVTSSVSLIAGRTVVSQTASVETVGVIEFESEINFSGVPLQMCLRMSRPDISLKRGLTSSVKLDATRLNSAPIVRRHQWQYVFPGATYSFGKANNLMCNVLLAS